MREIKFKAKRIDNGEWVEGWLVSDEGQLCYIIPDGTSMIYQDCGDELIAETARMVDPETVCEFTGLKDKNGVEIYDGDVLSDLIKAVDITVKHKDGCFVTKFATLRSHILSALSVVGNIHDEKEEG